MMSSPTRPSPTSLNYPDFIAATSQENTPPGASDTVARWLSVSGLNPHSRVLDLACSTGWASRQLHRQSGCEAVGIDISEKSIHVAQRKSSGRPKLSYRTGNAQELPFEDNSFTHIAAGCTFAFFQDAEAALSESCRVLAPGGLLMTSSFYYHTMPPERILELVTEVLGFRPRREWTLDYWRGFFGQAFEKELEYQSPILPIDPYVEDFNCRKTIFGNRAIGQIGMLDCSLVDAYRELLHQRMRLSAHRNYQNYVVHVWRKRD